MIKNKYFLVSFYSIEIEMSEKIGDEIGTIVTEKNETLGMIKKTPDLNDRKYTTEYDLEKMAISRWPLEFPSVVLTEISEAEFENREVFEITPILPIEKEGRFSKLNRIHPEVMAGVVALFVAVLFSSSIVALFSLNFFSSFILLFPFFYLFFNLICDILKHMNSTKLWLSDIEPKSS